MERPNKQGTRDFQPNFRIFLFLNIIIERIALYWLVGLLLGYIVAKSAGFGNQNIYIYIYIYNYIY